ncbi:DUF3800 domain-containing protein [Cellulosimicrobium cellulans]|uniref:DUF3800 domain-containing protein n=1 Tax=Cellulosimicrobium cellulans TaxID=1710 RepID=UPI0024076A26|nr:DUF3800 domain-containing protein [Cellulosimicrobium cellulans]MDF9877423.1 hypothetical protein [Cellulosimicrobium cellulans]
MLFVDESGTHGGSPAFVLGGAAIHEDDAQRLQVSLDELVVKHLGRIPVNLDEYELHAGEMRNAKKPRADASPSARASVWATIDRATRLALLAEAYSLVASFTPTDPKLPLVLFGVVLDAGFHAGELPIERERFAYEVLLNKFDVMLKNSRTERGRPNRGLVVHDRRLVAERDIQSWVSQWRAAAGTIGQLRNLADVPLFADSRATRLLQVADLVSYAMFRRYSPEVFDLSYFKTIWPAFHAEAGQVHGCVHYTPSYGQGNCACEACQVRLAADGGGPVRRRRGRSRRAIAP